MAAMAWKGMLTFGLVSIPIKMFVAARSKRVYLHQLHRDCHTRLKQPLFCPHCNRIVDRSEVIKGYEYETGQYVLVDQDEIKKITPPSGKTMEILAFVKENEIDPVYFDSSYFALADEQGHKGYALLVKALEDMKMVGIAKVTMHQREYTVFVRVRANGLTIHTMYYANEIASVEGYGAVDHVKVTPQEVKLAEQLVKSLETNFKPERYHDEFQERLRELVEGKAKGQKNAVAPEHHPGRVIDIMQALKKSLAAGHPAKPPERGGGKARPPIPITAHKQRRRKAS